MAGALRRRRSPPETLPLEGTYTDNLTDPRWALIAPRKCQICDPWETFIQLRARVWQKAVKYLMNESMARMRAQLKGDQLYEVKG